VHRNDTGNRAAGLTDLPITCGRRACRRQCVERIADWAGAQINDSVAPAAPARCIGSLDGDSPTVPVLSLETLESLPHVVGDRHEFHDALSKSGEPRIGRRYALR